MLLINIVTFQSINGGFRAQRVGLHSDDKLVGEQMVSCLELAGLQLKGAI